MASLTRLSLISLLGVAAHAADERHHLAMHELEHPAKHPFLRTILDPQREQSDAVDDKSRRLQSCTDSDSWYKNGNPAFDCTWVKAWAPRCDAKGYDGTLASEACPQV